jgi:hypothetical protein
MFALMGANLVTPFDGLKQDIARDYFAVNSENSSNESAHASWEPAQFVVQLTEDSIQRESPKAELKAEAFADQCLCSSREPRNTFGVLLRWNALGARAHVETP